jgi:hypothetical protein
MRYVTAYFGALVFYFIGAHVSIAQEVLEAEVCASEIQDLVARSLQHALVDAQDMPSIGDARLHESTYILNYLWENECLIDASAIPRSSEYPLVLVSREELEDLAAKSTEFIAYVRGGEARVAEDQASISLGVSLQLPPGDQAGLLCCCGGRMDLSRTNDEWEFVRWGPVFCS